MAFSKVVLSICLATIAVTHVSGQESADLCYPPGFPCSSDSQCCEPLICNPWAGRCTKAPSSLPPGDCTPAGAICSTEKACCEGLECDVWKNRCIKPKTTTALPSTEASTEATEASSTDAPTEASSTDAPTETTEASSTDAPTETTEASSTDAPTEATEASTQASIEVTEGTTEGSN